MFEIDSALRTLVERGGSDLHVKVESPADRPHPGRAGPLSRASAADARGHRDGLPGDRRGPLSGRIRGGGRGRLRLLDHRRRRASASTPSDSAARSRSSAARSPSRSARPRTSACRRSVLELAEEQPRHRPRHRHHRLGQEHDAGGDDRPHQPHPGAPHRHARGPDRVPARRQTLDRQPARSRRRHRELRAGDAPDPAPGPRRDPDRRDARRGDGPHGAVGGRDRPPRPLDPPHPRRGRDDQPHPRLLPAPPAAAGPGDARDDPRRRRSPSASSPTSTAAASRSPRSSSPPAGSRT